MSLKVKILDDMKSAMKERDTLKLETIRFLQSAVKNREIELRPAEIKDEEVMAVIKKLAKQRKESIEEFTKAGRTDLADKEKSELTILEAYLPKQMDRAQIEQLVAAVMADLKAATIKDMGGVMKEVTARSGGSADNKIVSEIVRSKLQG